MKKRSGRVACHIKHFHGLGGHAGLGIPLSDSRVVAANLFPCCGEAMDGWSFEESSAQGYIRRSVRYWIMYPGSRASVSDTNVTFACIVSFFIRFPEIKEAQISLVFWMTGHLWKGGRLKVKWLRQFHQNILRETNRSQMWARSFPQQLVCDVQSWNEMFQEIKATGTTHTGNCLRALRNTCLARPQGSLWKCLGLPWTS